MTPNPAGFGSDAHRFLSALAGGDAVTFQTFDDTPAKRKHVSRILHGSITNHNDKLRKLNQQGAGVFVMVNKGDCAGRSAHNVQSVRALFVDLDGSPLEPVQIAPIQPHITVESSPDRFHAYWLVDDLPLSDFRHFQQHLATRFDADPKVCDLPRVMRLPGFYHNKRGAHICRVLDIQNHRRIRREEFIEAFDIGQASIPVGNRNDALFKGAAGFKRNGIPKQAAQARIAKMNATRCEIPLEDGEITAIVNQAYSYPVDGMAMIPNAAIDRPEFELLSGVATKLLFFVLRRRRPGKEFSLTHGEFAHIPGMRNRQSFRSAIQELIDSGFIQMVRNYVAGTSPDGWKCALYTTTF